MNNWWLSLIAVAVFLSTIGMMAWHVRVWRAASQERLRGREYTFFRRQYRRRMQSSAMLGVAGLALIAGRWITSPFWGLFYWCVVFLWVLWLVLLALIDMLATWHHYGRMRRDYRIEELQIQTELHRQQKIRGNGKPQKTNKIGLPPIDPSAEQE